MENQNDFLEVLPSDENIPLDGGMSEENGTHSEVQVISYPVIEEKLDFLASVSLLMLVAFGVVCGLICCAIFSRYIHS